MTEAELRAMIDEGKPLSEIASEMADGEYDVCSRETLLSYAISEIENDRLFLARHILDAVDSGEYADFYFYDTLFHSSRDANEYNLELFNRTIASEKHLFGKGKMLR